MQDTLGASQRSTAKPRFAAFAIVVNSSSMKRIPELDSLRGIAAIAIVVFHLNPQAFYPGWTGVDLFFVLSGYLITGIILKHGETKGFLMNFYARRGLRIWPIYYLTLFFLIAINRFLPQPESLASVPYYLTYTQNIRLYWTWQSPSMPAFDHTWTLALEEQFYLIWPALLLLVKPKRIIPLCCATIALAWFAREGGWIAWSRYSERILLARCDGFALGGLLSALFLRYETAKVAQISVAAFVAAFVWMAWGIYEKGSGIAFFGLPTPDRPSSTILAVGVAYAGVVGVVVSYAGKPWLVPLRSRVLAYLGQISYGIYLYHIPIFWLMDGQTFLYQQSWKTRAMKLGATLVVSIASWHLIESPILRLKDRFAYREPKGVVDDTSGRVVE